MADAWNALCFSQPHWRVIASGHDVESWFAEDHAVGSGGILMPREIDVPMGHRYYRFTSSTSTREAQVGGGWWIDYENFSTISQFAAQHGYALPDAARLFLALPYVWTRVDRLVTALLAVPLKAYAGKGKPAVGTDRDPRDRGTTWIPLQHKPVTQLYIPGLVVQLSALNPSLRDPAVMNLKLYEKAFPFPTFDYIAGNRRTAPAPR